MTSEQPPEIPLHHWYIWTEDEAPRCLGCVYIETFDSACRILLGLRPGFGENNNFTYGGKRLFPSRKLARESWKAKQTWEDQIG